MDIVRLNVGVCLGELTGGESRAIVTRSKPIETLTAEITPKELKLIVQCVWMRIYLRVVLAREGSF